MPESNSLVLLTQDVVEKIQRLALHTLIEKTQARPSVVKGDLLVVFGELVLKVLGVEASLCVIVVICQNRARTCSVCTNKCCVMICQNRARTWCMPEMGDRCGST